MYTIKAYHEFETPEEVFEYLRELKNELLSLNEPMFIEELEYLTEQDFVEVHDFFTVEFEEDYNGRYRV